MRRPTSPTHVASPDRAARARLLGACVAVAVVGACAQEGAGWPLPRGPDPTPVTQQPPPIGRPQPGAGYYPGPPRPGGSTRTPGYGQPGPAPRPAGGPAVGLTCRADQDPVCALSRCVAGRCGGCWSPADCKAGATCAWTPVGMACVPGMLAGGAPPPPAGAGPFESARQACVAKTNELRARAGVGSVARRADAEGCGDSEAASDGAASQPHGAFGRCGESSQNECPGWNGTPDSVVSACLQSMFAEGPGEPYQDHGHYLNMTTAKYTGVACGFAVMPDGRVWMVQDFF